MLSLINSIQHFNEFGVRDLEKVMMNYSADMTKIAEMVYGVRDGVIKLGLNIIAEELENYDNYIRESDERKQNWSIVKRDETTLLTSLGSVTYHKTLFIHKETKERTYLLDRFMGIEKHARMTEDAEAAILEEAVETSYRKGGENASISSECVSKQTVMNKLRELRFPDVAPQECKKAVPYLYIDGDEDHVALQYLQQKGDIEGRRRINTAMPKIVYVYEGITNENGRNELINVRYFGGLYEGSKGNEMLWKKVWSYIEESYDVEAIKKIYINGDGATWIKNGTRWISNAKFVLDKFHMHKYIIGATSHLLDSVEDARNEIYRAIHKRKKWMAEESFEKILNVTTGEAKRKTVEAAKTYILGNWTGIMEQVSNKNGNIECSAEGHVSHVYADRMSSRPLGWSKEGVEQMAQLRIYYYNNGNMLDLVRYQNQPLPVTEEAKPTLQLHEILRDEERHNKELGKLANVPVCSILYPQIKKKMQIRHHILGL